MKNHFIVFAFALFSVLPSLAQPGGQSAPLPLYVSNYLRLKDEMFASNMANIKLSAKAMKEKLTTKEITDPTKLEQIKTSLDAIVSATDINAQRTAFAKLSQFMISLVEAQPIPGITIYSDFCPMARDGKGAYWLSLEKEVRNNPYMGSKMPYCGTVDQKIAK